MMMQRALTTLAIAFFLTVAFQTYELFREHANLENAQAGQQAPLEQAVQTRQETEGLAGDVAALADKGNANAKQIVEGMRQQGITLRTPQAAAGAKAPTR
jgi:ABC-type polar amino acid transport system ATPase subunit